MEIFQTIWTALSTPNEGLINIISIPFTFLEVYMQFLIFSSILNLNVTKKRKTVYVIVTSALIICSNFLLPKQYSVFCNMIFLFACIMIILKPNIIKGIIALLLPSIIVALLDTIIIKYIFILFGVTREQTIIIPIYRIFSVFIVYIFIYLLYKTIIHFKINLQLLDNINKKSKFILIFNLIIACITIVIQFYLVGYYNEILPLYITFLSLISMLTYFFISIYSLNKVTQLQITTQNLEQANLYNKSLKILHDNLRAFKHDFSNIVQAIGGYVTSNDMKGLETYYYQLLEDCQKVNNLYTLSPEVINNPAIYSILASKYHMADELGIKINLEIFLNLDDLHMKIYEFTRVLGILMDNAIEAAKECNQKIINVQIRKDFNVNRQLLIIENTYTNKDVDLDKIYEKGYSSKPNNTGLGLWEVRQIMKKNKNLNLYSSKNDTYFSQQLEMYA